MDNLTALRPWWTSVATDVAHTSDAAVSAQGARNLPTVLDTALPSVQYNLAFTNEER